MASQTNSVNVNSVSRISAGTVIKGEIQSPYDLRIDGTFEGKIQTKGRVVVGESAIIKGDIICENVDLWGIVEGDLFVKDTLALKEGCKMNGNINISRLAVELGGSEENFAETAAKYSVDSSAANGGLYENIFKGQMVAEFEDWCFDSARKPGDSEIIKTSYGYHIMYFSGVSEEYYSYAIGNTVKNVRLNDYINELIEGVEVSELSGNKYVGRHFG